jgi:hypothetical protein
MWPNAWVAAVAFAGAMPLLAALAVVAWLGALLPGAHLEARRSGLPSAFFAAFLAEAAPRCGPPPDSTCAAPLTGRAGACCSGARPPGGERAIVHLGAGEGGGKAGRELGAGISALLAAPPPCMP